MLLKGIFKKVQNYWTLNNDINTGIGELVSCYLKIVALLLVTISNLSSIVIGSTLYQIF